MYSRKQILDFAFQEALNNGHLNGMDKDLMEDVLATSMRAYAEREGFEFTEEEIHSTIVASIETLNKAGEDFTLQTKMML